MAVFRWHGGVSGWFSESVFITDDAEYLVRMTTSFVGDKPSKSDVALAFYKQGSLIADFKTADLVKDTSKIQLSLTRYFWLSSSSHVTEPGSVKLSGTEFSLVTADGIVYFFDVTTGKLKSGAP